MAFDASAHRRLSGGLALLAALAMLVCGETVLKDRLGMLSFLIYWLILVALLPVSCSTKLGA